MHISFQEIRQINSIRNKQKLYTNQIFKNQQEVSRNIIANLCIVVFNNNIQNNLTSKNHLKDLCGLLLFTVSVTPLAPVTPNEE